MANVFEKTQDFQRLKRINFHFFILVWMFVWFIGLSCEPLFTILGLAYWSSPVGLSFLILRDMVFGLLALDVWSIVSHRTLADYTKFFQYKTRSEWERLGYRVAFLMLTLWYFFVLYAG